MTYFLEKDPEEARIASETLERYCGSQVSHFQPLMLLTNFHHYITRFAETHQVALMQGSMFNCAHCPELGVSILDYKLGAAAAALTVDLCSFVPQVKAAIMLGMCGGLRRHFKIGDYLLPVAGIRAEGASDFYFPPQVPALANFLIQKAVTNVLEEQEIDYHVGITYTSNIRFWEFNERFKEKLRETRAQAYEMECATLFAASYRRKFPLGALLLISDLPMTREGIKTKESSKKVFETYTDQHIQVGIDSLKVVDEMLAKKMKGARRSKAD